MIENLTPSSAITAIAPAVTAIVYTGDFLRPVEPTDLALGLENGEVIPLSVSLFQVAGQRATHASAEAEAEFTASNVATLLRCTASAETFQRVAMLSLLQATTDVAELRRASDRARAETPSPTKSGPMTGSMEAMLAAMDAAEAARTEPLLR